MEILKNYIMIRRIILDTILYPFSSRGKSTLANATRKAALRRPINAYFITKTLHLA